jgi:hypothetical protein
MEMIDPPHPGEIIREDCVEPLEPLGDGGGEVAWCLTRQMAIRLENGGRPRADVRRQGRGCKATNLR